MLLTILLAQLLAGAADWDPAHPPHQGRRPPRDSGPRRHRLPHRDSLAGRRPRG